LSNNNLYTPGLHKLSHHLEHLKKIRDKEICGPIHVSIWPNNSCNLKCSYCCFRKIKRNFTELNYEDFCKGVDVLQKYGLKAVEFSGGGEPTLWKDFDNAVRYVNDKKLNLSLVTNGIKLNDISEDVLGKFNWIRISIQSVKQLKDININHIPYNVRKSFSYIVYSYEQFPSIRFLSLLAEEMNFVIRIAPYRPCDDAFEYCLEKEVEKFGYPLVFFKKVMGKPLGCYFTYIRAAIDWNGNFLPCPSIELSNEYAGTIPDNFPICHVSKLEMWLQNNPPHDMGFKCSFCNCGKDVNDFIHNLLEEKEDVNFV